MVDSKKVNKDALLAEYKCLRDEIVAYGKYSNDLFNYSLVSFGALITLAINKPEFPQIYTIMVFIFLIITIRRRRINKSVNNVAAFMSVYIEPYLEAKWETISCEYKSRTKISKTWPLELGREPLLLCILSMAIMIYSYKDKIFNEYLFLFIINSAFFVIILLLTIKNTSKNNSKEKKNNELKYIKIMKQNNPNGV